MRLFGSFLLILITLLSTSLTALVRVNYELNREVIAQYFCVNRDRPEMHCEGQCHLRQQLDAAQSAEQSLTCAPGGDFFDPARLPVLPARAMEQGWALATFGCTALPNKPAPASDGPFHPPRV